MTPAFNVKLSGQQPTGLVELFLLSTGGSVAHKSFAKSQVKEDELVQWNVGLLGYVNHVAALMYPFTKTKIVTLAPKMLKV